MKIQYLGHSSFLIKSKTASVVTDPFDPTVTGLKFPSVEADIVTVSHSHDDHNYVNGVNGNKRVFDFPGEYERRGVRILGYQTHHDMNEGAERGENTMFKIIIDGVHILHCGDLGHMLTDELIEQVKDTNILLLPVGGTYTMGPKDAYELYRAINPEVVIPMHYASPKLKQEAFGVLAPVEEFLKLAGKEGLAPLNKFEADADSLPDKEVVLLSF